MIPEELIDNFVASIRCPSCCVTLPKETGKKSTKKKKKKTKCHSWRSVQSVASSRSHLPKIKIADSCFLFNSAQCGRYAEKLTSSVSRRGSLTRPRAIELDASKHIDVLYLLNQIIFLRSKRKETYQKKNMGNIYYRIIFVFDV